MAALATAGPVARGQSAPATGPATARALPTDLVGRRVSAVRVAGNVAVTNEVILNRVRTHVGDRFDPAVVEDDYQRIYGLKRFSNVGARVEPDGAGGVAVVFQVAEERVIKSVRFTGNRTISTEDLTKEIDLKPGESIEPFRINIARRAIVGAYKAKNHPYAHVDVDQDLLSRTGELVFNVVEAQPVTIRNIEFVGRKSFTYDRLKDQIKTTRWYWIFNAGTLDEQQVAADAAAVRRYYRNHGFFDCRVGHKVIISPDQTEAQVNFLVDEGPQYTVDKVTFSGVHAVPEATLRKDLKLTGGQTFDAEVLALDVKKLVKDYSPLGYIWDERGRGGPDDLHIGKPGGEYPVTVVPHLKPGVVDLVWEISEGKPQQVGRIYVTGDGRSDEKLVRRELRMAPGQRYDSGAVEDAADRLRGTPYFSNATFTPIPPSGGEPDTRDLLVDVTEKQTGFVRAGASVNSSLGLVGDFSYDQKNFDIANPSLSPADLVGGLAWTGAGQEFRVDLQPGTTVTSASVLFVEPYVFDQPYSFAPEGYYRQFYREGWAEQHAGASITVGRQFDYFLSGAVTFQGEDVNIRDVSDYFPANERVNVIDPITRQPRLNGQGRPVRQQRSVRAADVLQYAGHNTVTNVGLTLRYDTTNHGPLTYQGTSVKGAYQLYGALGGEFHFSQFNVGLDNYWTVAKDLLDRRTVLAVHAGASYNTPDAPFFERFYGGQQDGTPIRGFAYRGVGPRSGRAQDPIGGNFGLSTTLELNFPVYGDGVRGVIFNDLGTVEPDIRIHTIRDSVGVGVRVVLPFLGPTPFAFDLAFPVLQGDQDIKQVFSFGIRT